MDFTVAYVIEVHETPIHPLPSMEIDESTITGNVQIMEAINRELRNMGAELADGEPKYVQMVSGDQLTMQRQRSGLFHAKIADCHGLLLTHFGISSIRSPGSLAYHNTCLDRIPIVLTSLPSFRVCRDLIMVSLYARVLHCLQIVSGTRVQPCYHQSIRKCRPCPAVTRASRNRAAKNPATSAKSPSQPRAPHKGDEVYENAQLFLRDALFTRLFSDAVKAGDSGMVVVVLKIWTMTYRGSGRSKYAHEMLHLFQNLVNVWSKDLREVVLNNWLANPTGKPNAFVELDLVQEHLNFWIKKVYRADGDAHSWEWLEVVSPCIEVLRKLSRKLNFELGSKQSSKHSTPDLQNDISTLMNVLKNNQVYEFKEGRMVDAKDAPVPDVLAAGWSALTQGTNGPSPLQDFNNEFEQIRARRSLVPVDLAAVCASTMPPPPTDTPMTPDHHALTPENGAAEDFETENLDEPDPGQDGLQVEDDFEVASPTLTRLDAMDVDLDMDEFDLDDEWGGDEGEDGEE